MSALVIHRYKFPVHDEDFTLDIPEYAFFLTVQVKEGEPCLWMRIDPDMPKVARRFVLYATGQPAKARKEDEVEHYMGTFMLRSMEISKDWSALSTMVTLVFHLFEVTSSSSPGDLP